MTLYIFVFLCCIFLKWLVLLVTLNNNNNTQMTRRELFLRMAQGEKLTGSDMRASFSLGQRDLDLNNVSSRFVSQLITDGLASAINTRDEISIVLTAQVDDWFVKRNIHVNPFHFR